MSVHFLKSQPSQSTAPASEGAAPAASPKVRCRAIEPADFDSIADLLTVGFPRRARSYWVQALQALSQLPLVEGSVRYGYMLESDAKAVGVILLLFSKAHRSDEIRCNGSSWYVEPAYRSVGISLLTRTLKHKATHTNLSPAPHVVPIFEALGYRKFCDGLFAAVPTLAGSGAGTKIVRVSGRPDARAAAPTDDLRLLSDHARFGCVSLWCENQGEASPFIFRRRFVKGLPAVPAAQLIYCDSIDKFARFAGPIGRYLALRGMPFMIAPANGPIAGLAGKYFGGKPMYFRGPSAPQLGDMAYSEISMFGI